MERTVRSIRDTLDGILVRAEVLFSRGETDRLRILVDSPAASEFYSFSYRAGEQRIVEEESVPGEGRWLLPRLVRAQYGAFTEAVSYHREFSILLGGLALAAADDSYAH